MSLAHLRDLAALAGRSAEELAAVTDRYAGMVRQTLAGGGTVYYAGNGGSAAHAQHVATEYVVRYRPTARRAASAVALSADTSLVTAAGNDLGFEQVFARQIEAHARAGDLVVLVSTSGNSANLVRAAETARGLGVPTVGLLAAGGGRLAGLVDLAIVVPTDDPALAQEIQLALDHHVCGLIESDLPS